MESGNVDSSFLALVGAVWLDDACTVPWSTALFDVFGALVFGPSLRRFSLEFYRPFHLSTFLFFSFFSSLLRLRSVAEQQKGGGVLKEN